MPRSLLLLGLWALACVHSPLTSPARFPGAEERVADLDQLWQFVADRYPYFADKPVDWAAVRAAYRERVRAATDRHELVRVFEDMLDELYDAHSHLGTNYDDSWRLVPYDLWAEWHGDHAIIAEVRRDSAARAAGLRPGMEITAIDGVDVAAATRARGPHHLRAPDPAAAAWALLSALGGRHDRPRRIDARDRDGTLRRYNLGDEPVVADPPVVSARMLDATIGYVRIASFGTRDAVTRFDAALEAMRAAKALVIDVRDNSGGDTLYARPILGRLISKRAQYAWMAKRDGPGLSARWPEYVDPIGPWTFEGPVVVLVNHWSESMAEGFALAIDGMHRGVVVGTQMAGLGAAIARITLARSKLPVQISAEPVFHVDGRTRNEFRPTVLVDLSAESSDPILDAGITAAQRALAPARAVGSE